MIGTHIDPEEGHIRSREEVFIEMGMAPFEDEATLIAEVDAAAEQVLKSHNYANVSIRGQRMVLVTWHLFVPGANCITHHVTALANEFVDCYEDGPPEVQKIADRLNWQPIS